MVTQLKVCSRTHRDDAILLRYLLRSQHINLNVSTWKRRVLFSTFNIQQQCCVIRKLCYWLICTYCTIVHPALSGMNDAEKKMCGGVIENLGGELINSVGFDSRCTHLIVSCTPLDFCRINDFELWKLSICDKDWMLIWFFTNEINNKCA